MTKVLTTEVPARLVDLASRIASGERIVVCEGTEPILAFVSPSDLDLLERLEDALDVLEAQSAIEEAERDGSRPLESVLADLGLSSLLQ